ncbi:MAG: kpsM [Enterovirga sp.]|jgi:capsular polysaccharide transport system permease protein|nr:kpsM [Enterovirga sp.]
MKDPATAVQLRVLGALLLRDVKTRFGGKAANYLIAIGWPLVHMAVLLTIYTFMGRSAPVGNSTPLFFATGLLPYMTFQYPSRQMMLGPMMNGPLLSFPVVNFMDLVLARAILEFITACAVILLFAFILFSFGVDITPRYPAEAVSALAAALFLALSVGVVNTVINRFLKIWFIAYILVMILLYIASGIVFLPEAVPEKYRDILVWNPGLQVVEWFRSAYYEGYGKLTLDKTYVIVFSLVALAIGLTAERLTRRINPA